VIVANLNVPARDHQLLRLPRQRIREFTLPQFTQQRRVIGKNAQVPILARNLRRLSILFHYLPFRRYDFDLKSGSHLLLLDLFPRFQHVLNRALHVECLLRNLVVLAFHHFFEAPHGVRDLDVFAFAAREHFGHVEGL